MKKSKLKLELKKATISALNKKFEMKIIGGKQIDAMMSVHPCMSSKACLNSEVIICTN